MSQFYELIRSLGIPPVDLADMKSYLKINYDNDDDFLISLIEAATIYGEKYTGRDFRAKEWRLLEDFLTEETILLRDRVSEITIVAHLVGSEFEVIDPEKYYLKKSAQYGSLMFEGDIITGDSRSQSVRIEFKTEACQGMDLIKNAIMRHVAFCYSNRGDCGDMSAKASGVSTMYQYFKIARY